jgi:hypothetical protein
MFFQNHDIQSQDCRCHNPEGWIKYVRLRTVNCVFSISRSETLTAIYVKKTRTSELQFRDIRREIDILEERIDSILGSKIKPNIKQGTRSNDSLSYDEYIGYKFYRNLGLSLSL